MRFEEDLRGVIDIHRIVCYLLAMELHSIQSGSGPPLLLIHGLFDSCETWEKLTPLLSKRFKVYAIDLPAFGKTPLPDTWGESLSGMVDAMIQFLNDKRIEKVSLLGSSMGGGVSLALAQHSPERIEKIALLNPYALPVVPMAVKGARRPIAGRLLPFLLRRMAIRRCAKGIFTRSIYDQTLVTDRMLDRVVAPFSTLHSRKALFRFLRLISSEKIMEVDRLLPSVKQPVLVLWGKEDGWLSNLHWKRLMERLPHSKVLQISECGHLPHLEKPELVAEAVLPFFSTLRK